MNFFKNPDFQPAPYDREAALEGAYFQTHSPLAAALVKSIQETMDYRDTLDYTNITDKRKHRILMVEKHATTVLFPAIKKAISAHTNLEVTKLNHASYGFVNCYFAVDLSMDNLRDAVTVIDQQTGMDAGPSTMSESLNEMMRMSENFDPKNAKLTSSAFGNNKKRKITAEIWFDVNGAFLAKDYLPNSFVDDFKAEEIAAIMLHEVGHVLVMVERAGDFYAKMERHTEHLTKVAKFTTPRDLIADLAKNGDEFFNTLVKNNVLSEQTAKTVQDGIKGLHYAYEEQAESLLKFVLTFLGTIVVVSIMTLVAVLPQTIIACFLFKWATTTGNEFGSNHGGKTSDVKNTKQNMYMFERLADEFVSRMGLGGPLAFGLNKMHKILEMIQVGGDVVASSEWMRKMFLLHYGYKLCAVVWRIPGAFMGDTLIYETDIDRVKRLLQNNMAAYKNNLPPKVRDRYMIDAERTMLALEEAKGNIAHKSCRFILDWFMTLTNPTKLIAVLSTGRLTNDYTKLLNQLQSLINNRLYYLGAKFQQISETIK